MVFSQHPESWPSSIWVCGSGWGSPVKATWLDHLHSWKVCSTWEKVFSWFCYMRKKKWKGLEKTGQKNIYRSKYSGSKDMQETDFWGESGGIERQAEICTPSFLTALTLITSGRSRITSEQYLVPPWMSQSTSSISPDLSGKASTNMLHLLNRTYVCICFLCQGKGAIKRVSYAKDVLNGGARYCHKLSYSIYQGFWCWRLAL